jgi:beta-glucosidase
MIADSAVVDNFESGLTTGRDIFNNPIGYSTWGSTQGNVAITVTRGMTLPGGTLLPPNTALQVTSNIENWGGFTDAFKDDQSWGHQDWSRYDGMRFWFYGTNSGKQIQVEIFDNRQLENIGDSAERYYQRFADNFSGWQQISLPFALFQRRTDYQPGGAPADGLNLTDVSGYAFNLPSSARMILYRSMIELYGDLSAHPVTTRGLLGLLTARSVNRSLSYCLTRHSPPITVPTPHDRHSHHRTSLLLSAACSPCRWRSLQDYYSSDYRRSQC